MLELPGLTDSGVETLGLLLRLRTLREYPFGEVELPTQLGQHPHDGRGGRLYRLIGFDCQ
jgi:hypothetical protein